MAGAEQALQPGSGSLGIDLADLQVGFAVHFGDACGSTAGHAAAIQRARSIILQQQFFF